MAKSSKNFKKLPETKNMAVINFTKKYNAKPKTATIVKPDHKPKLETNKKMVRKLYNHAFTAKIVFKCFNISEGIPNSNEIRTYPCELTVAKLNILDKHKRKYCLHFLEGMSDKHPAKRLFHHKELTNIKIFKDTNIKFYVGNNSITGECYIPVKNISPLYMLGGLIDE